jgi:hypothetical protein
MANFLKHLAALIGSVGPLVVALEAVPGPIGKAALIAASVLSTIATLRAKLDPKAEA